MNKEHDRRIKHLFEQLKKEEERGTPSFQVTLDGRETVQGRPAPWFGFLLRPAVVMLVLAIIAVPVLYNSLPGPAEVEVSAELENWESPTDFLLSFNENPLLTDIPEIETSIWEIEEDQYIEVQANGN